MDFPGWSMSAFGVAAVLAGILFAGAVRRIWSIRIGKWIFVPLAFMGYCLVRCFGGMGVATQLDTFAQMASAFLGGIALALALRAGVKFKTLVYAQIVANLFQIAAVALGIGAARISDDATFRYGGLTGNPNLLALQLTLGACLIWLMPRDAGVLPCAFSVVSVGFAVAVTGSRKAVLLAFFFLILGLVQVVYLVPRSRRRLATLLAIAVPGLIGVFFGSWLFQKGVGFEAVQRLVDYQDSSFELRADMIQQGIRLWAQAPIFGNGLAAFQALSGQDTYAHNNYVELLCNLGVVGALLYYSIYGMVFIRSWHAPRHLRLYCRVLALALLVADVGYVSYKSKQTIMLLMVLLMVATSRHGPRGHRSRRPRRPAKRVGELSVPRFIFRT